MEFVAAVGVLVLVVCLVLGVIATVRAVRAVRSGVQRASTEVRRTYDHTALRVRSATPGPVGELARTRLALRTSVDSTRRELAMASPEDASLAEAAALLDRLYEHAQGLDREMGSLMDREPDNARIAARLPELRERAGEIRQSADSLRFAAQDRARRHRTEELGSLREQIALESGALRHWDPPAGPTAPDAASAQPHTPRVPSAEPWPAIPDPGPHPATAERSATRSPELSPRHELGPEHEGLGLGRTSRARADLRKEPRAGETP